MFRINNTNFKKHKIPLFLLCLGLGGIFLFQYLTFIPEYSSAEEISTPIYDGEPRPDDRTLSQITYMQEMTSGVCERSAIGEENVNVIDERDSSGYSIKRLSDERCWMTQNLRIVNKEITPIDSNITANYTIPASDTKGFYENAASDVYYNDNTAYGAYYTWCAATAGCKKENETNPGANENAASSICPKGWRLPTGGSGGEFEVLNNKGSSWETHNGMNGSWIGGTISTTSAAFFPAGGNVNSGKVDAAGTYGRYWSSTAYDSKTAYALYFNSSSVNPSGHNNRYYGRSVRCINDPDIKNSVIKPDVSIPNPNVSVTVDKILTLEVTDKEVNIEPKTNEIMTGNFTATVSSNAGYDIGLSAAEDSSIALVNKKDNIIVAEIPASNNIQVGNNGWGIKCIDDEDCILKSYNALTLYNNPQVYFSSTNAATNKPTNFEVGISISPSLPSGTYSTNILVTASQK